MGEAMARHAFALLLFAPLCLAGPEEACAWGDEGHRIIGRIALPLLTPQAKARVEALLAADPDTLTAPDFVSRTTWADRWRDSDRNTTKVRYMATQQWHFVDIELTKPDLADACAGFPSLPVGTPASAGPAQDCVLDKVQQFSTELADPNTSDAERILALKYLLHFTGDLHQPLHAADNHDRGGNDVLVLFGRHHVASKLHAYWDTAVVERIGRDEAAVAAEVTSTFGDRRAEWQQGQPSEWAQESFAAARDVAYALPTSTVPDEHGTPAYALDEAYGARAEATAREQLAKAGFRLARILNEALP
ncbi:S1/P1 nuclease [Methylobacterium sp. OT2]|uniref:S1/P1 nuclease n=1 Tax=Methylobacterium sp. OT2 TaxID=2813779 RepID=UPI00197B13E3|nr:S1/P1 nuclease [Methylobacterium sp. OT2]MBN4096074.1 S1/P1 nuclease [Methylobacterium sp. OT2]